MKKILLLFVAVSSTIIAGAWDFAEPNADGDTIYYNIKDSHSVIFDAWNDFPAETRYLTDTLRLPEKVVHNGTEYQVGYSETDSNYRLGFLMSATKASPRYLSIPASLFVGTYSTSLSLYLLPLNNENFRGYCIDTNHPVLSSEDGMILSKSGDSLLLFPMWIQGTYTVPEHIRYIGNSAFWYTGLDSLILPENIDIRFGYNFIAGARVMESFRYPNSITRLDNGVGIWGDRLKEIIFGSGLQYIGGTVFGYNLPILERVFCLAVTPPQTSVEKFNGSEKLTLYVPRKSIDRYKSAPGWRSFEVIAPIEPPVVAGTNSAEISWVTNAEASSYSLTLYLDAEQTRRLVTLTFDDRGYLTGMDFNPDVVKAPAAMPNRVKQAPLVDAEDSSTEFNTYLSFTVTGLNSNSNYYFVRQTLNAIGEVIDEESGSFVTRSNPATQLEGDGIESVIIRKFIENGQMYIRRNERTYTLQGIEVK